MLQETRGIPADLEGLPPSHRYWGTFALHRDGPPGTARGGTVIAIRRDWAETATSMDVVPIARARARARCHMALGCGIAVGGIGAP